MKAGAGPQSTERRCVVSASIRSKPNAPSSRHKNTLFGTTILPDCKQMRALARQERARGDLAFELSRPATGNGRGAVRAAAIGRQAIVPDQIAVALNQSFAALRTARVFPFRN